MGGFGSGRINGQPRRWFTTELRSVTIRDVLTLLGRDVDEIALAGCPVRVARTGRRQWFECPGCLTARGVLYEGGGGWRCRVCLDLAYPSQHQNSRRIRAFRRILDSEAWRALNR